MQLRTIGEENLHDDRGGGGGRRSEGRNDMLTTFTCQPAPPLTVFFFFLLGKLAVSSAAFANRGYTRLLERRR